MMKKLQFEGENSLTSTYQLLPNQTAPRQENCGGIRALIARKQQQGPDVGRLNFRILNKIEFFHRGERGRVMG